VGRKYTDKTIFARAVFVAAALLLTVFFAIRLDSGQQPEALRQLANAKGTEFLALRDWMQQNDIDTVMVLSRYNRSEGQGVSLGFSRYACYFDGAGADALLSTNGISATTDKALALAQDADSYGAYKYVREANCFEAWISGDAYSRPSGTAGTPLYYAGDDGAVLTGMDEATELGGGWYAGRAQSGGLVIDTRSSWFYISVILLVYAAAVTAVELGYKKREARATVAGRRSEDVRHLSRLTRQLQGKPMGGFDGFAYQMDFKTAEGGTVTVYVPHAMYQGLNDGDAGWLVYKQRGKRRRFVSFTVEQSAGAER